MVRVFCDRCGRVITGMSAHERVSVTASGAGGGEIAKLDFCTYCADWAINTLMRRTMLGAGEKKGAKADKPAPIAEDPTHVDGMFQAKFTENDGREDFKAARTAPDAERQGLRRGGEAENLRRAGALQGADRSGVDRACEHGLRRGREPRDAARDRRGRADGRHPRVARH